METINISQFMGYFGSYYPIILPVFVALCIISAYVLDIIRVGAVSYVDEGESGPYKRYVSTFFHKLMDNEPFGETKTHSIKSDEAINLKVYCKNYQIGRDDADHKVEHQGKTISVYYEYQLDKLRDFLKRHPDISLDLLLELIEKGNDHPIFKAEEVWDPFDTLKELVIYLVIFMLGLTAYKFLPAITVGAIVGYCVLRLARSIVRLTKKFNKHISDGHGVKVEATEAKEML